jgi:hypothetical protein
MNQKCWRCIDFYTSNERMRQFLYDFESKLIASQIFLYHNIGRSLIEMKK